MSWLITVAGLYMGCETKTWSHLELYGGVGGLRVQNLGPVFETKQCFVIDCCRSQRDI